MNRITGSALIIAGTAIGAGMIAMPMVLSKIGLLPGVIVLLFIWASVYYSALVITSLNLRTGRAVSIGSIARDISGRRAEWFYQFCMLLLTYALMVAYLSGGASIIQSLIHSLQGDETISYDAILIAFTLFVFMVLALKTWLIDSINRILFFGLIGALTIVIVGIGSHLQGANLPFVGEKINDTHAWLILLPVVFTSFGYQLTVPSIVAYLNLNPQHIKKSLGWGSLIPVIVYSLWSLVTLGILHQADPASYHESLSNGQDVGHFIEVMTHVTQWPGLRHMSWIVSILAIVTSAIGVGLGIKSFWKEKLPQGKESRPLEFISGALAVVIPYMISHVLKDAFMQSLAFAGMILVTLAILIPIFLLFKAEKNDHDRGKSAKPLPYKILENRPLRILIFILGLGIFFSEIINLIG